jgi:predicted AAA+ superfamily ATPase
VAALCSGTMINFTNIASDAQVPRTTIHEYFEILRDTLLLHEIPAWQKSDKRKPIRTSNIPPSRSRPRRTFRRMTLSHCGPLPRRTR